MGYQFAAQIGDEGDKVETENPGLSFYDTDFEVMYACAVCNRCGDYEEIEDLPPAQVPEAGFEGQLQPDFDFGQEELVRHGPDNRGSLELALITQPCACGGEWVIESLESYGFLDSLTFRDGRIVECGGGVLAEYGSLYGYQDVIRHEVRVDNGRLIRTLLGNGLNSNERKLIEETYGLKGDMEAFHCHPLLEPYIDENLLRMPLQQSRNSEGPPVYEKIEIEQLPNVSDKENDDRFLIDRQSEWISDVNREHLYIEHDEWYDGATTQWKTNRLKTSTTGGNELSLPVYQWGNCPEFYCGFVHEFWKGTKTLKTRYYVWGGIVTNQPRLSFTPEGRLESVRIRVDGEDYSVWESF